MKLYVSIEPEEKGDKLKEILVNRGINAVFWYEFTGNEEVVIVPSESGEDFKIVLEINLEDRDNGEPTLHL